MTKQLAEKISSYMATLHTKGVRYDYPEEKSLAELHVADETLDYDDFFGDDEIFAKDFKKFATMPGYTPLHCECYAWDSSDLVIQFSRSLSGAPKPSFIYLNVRVFYTQLGYFVKEFAKYC